MKKSTVLSIAAVCFLLIHTDGHLYAQANETLSNLTSPTAVNQSLAPNTDNSKNLGSSSKSWKDIYLDGYLYMDGTKVITNVGTLNWFFGFNAGNTTTAGSDNTAVGVEAGKSLTAGSRNAFLGSFAGSQTTSGSDNVYVGDGAGYVNTSGSKNTLLGSFAGFSNAGSEMTAVGYQALYSNTGSDFSSGAGNCALGSQSLYSNTTGSYNTASGYQSLYSNNGFYNTANGYQSLYSNTTGGSNTASGWKSLYSNTTGSYNSAHGTYSLYDNTTGHDNTADGYYSLERNTTGNYNTGVGNSSLFFNTTGSDNTAIGTFALKNNTNGDDNTAVGHNSLYFNTTGIRNVSIGTEAGKANTTANYNVFIGYQAGDLVTSGSNNTSIGSFSDINATTFTNATAVGYNSGATASNQVRIGNGTVTSIGGYAGWTNLSDGRFKKNVNENVPGLEFITGLRPVTYTLDVVSLRKAIGEYADEGVERTIEDIHDNQQSVTEKEQIVYTGFIAQEVEKVAKKLEYDFSGIDAPKNENDIYGLRYAEFVVPLVKAVQELSATNEELTARIEKLESLLNVTATSQAGINTELSAQRIILESNGNTATLDQNIPNPFTGKTTIQYYVPALVTSSQIKITTQNGVDVRTFYIDVGRGSIEVDATQLASGSYLYSLVVDGRITETKQMILTK